MNDSLPQIMKLVAEEVPPVFIPEAYLNDASGIKIVAKIRGSEEYVLLAPPAYTILPTYRGTWVKDAALAKFGFESYEGPATETDNIQELILLCTSQIQK